MTFQSILFPNPADHDSARTASEPEYFSDLALDQVIAAICTGKEEYDLERYFYVPLSDADDVVFRQEVMQDLEQPQVLAHVKAFAESMRAMRRNRTLAERLFYQHEKEYWVLDAVTIYGTAVGHLADGLSAATLASRGLSALRDYVRQLIGSDGFTTLLRHAEKLKKDLSEIRYNLLIKGTTVEVRHHEGEPDYSLEVDAVFENFKQGAVEEYRFDATDSGDTRPRRETLSVRVLRPRGLRERPRRFRRPSDCPVRQGDPVLCGLPGILGPFQEGRIVFLLSARDAGVQGSLRLSGLRHRPCRAPCRRERHTGL